MSETRAFTIESFYKFIGEGKLFAAKCGNCEAMLLPPRPICPKCFSKNLSWVPVNNAGKLLTYTVIHVAPKQFEAQTPYPIGIVKLDHGIQLLGMIRGVEPDQLKVGMPLTVNFEKTSTQPTASTEWPTWPKYYFTSS